MADRVAVMDHGRVQQVATPEELYVRPANRFVAEFIGKSNLFEGVATAGGLKVGDRTLPGHGEGRYLVVRPEQMRISDAGLVTGTVLETQFAGGTSTIAVAPRDVATASGQPLLVTQPGFPTVERGAEVSLSWDPAMGVLVS